MKTSILICATCLVVTGCSAQLRFPSLSSALSSLTGFGGGSSSGGNNGQAGSQAAQSSPYSGLVRDYGRNLMMAMSSIYPTLFKPPQAQQQQLQQQSPQGSQSPYDQFSSGQHSAGQNLFSSQSAPSFSFGGSTFSISPSLPFGSLGGASQPQPSQAAGPGGSPHSPFSASFGSSINSPSSFGSLSSAPFLPQSMPSFAPASSYNAAFEAANGGPSASFGQSLGGPSSMHSQAGVGPGPSSGPLSSSQLLSQQSNPSAINSYAPMQGFSGQHDSSAPMASQSAHQPQTAPLSQQSGLGMQSSFGAGGPQQMQAGHQLAASSGQQQYSSQQYRPDMMLAASAPVPSSNSYSNYGSIPSGPSQQAPASSSSYQQPSYR